MVWFMYNGRGVIAVATWIAHLRVAERLINLGIVKNTDGFIIGNIAPDSGVPNADRSSFDPPKSVTHWIVGNNHDYHSFREQYLSGVNVTSEDYDSSFLLGYYVHLLSDEVWGTMFKRKLLEPLYKDNLERDPGYIWTIKKDWYGHDLWYLQENPESLFFKHFLHLTGVRDVLPYFPQGAVANQTEYIKNYYLTRLPDFSPDRQWPYLSKAEMENYVDEATEFCAARLGEIG